MSTLAKIITATIAGILMTSCNIDINLGSGITGDGNVVSEIRKPFDFIGYWICRHSVNCNIISLVNRPRFQLLIDTTNRFPGKDNSSGYLPVSTTP